MTLPLLTEPVELVCAERGDGVPLVLLHGFPLDSALWRAQVETLSAQCSVITPDLRGHGASPAPVGAYSMALMAQDVFRALDRLHVQQAVIAGHSMGGYVALAMYRLAPERFLGFGMIASQHLADTPEAQAGRHALAEAMGQPGALPPLNPALFGDSTPADSPLRAQVDAMIRATPPAGVAGCALAMAARPDSSDLLPRIGVPSLVLAGEQDKIIRVERALAMAALLQHEQLVVVPGAGHLPMMERADAVNDALLNLVRRVARSA